MKSMDNRQLVHETGMMLVQALNGMTTPQEKVTACASVTFNCLTTLAAMIMGGQFDPSKGQYPTNDHCLLAMFLTHEASSMMSDATVRVEFGPARLMEALEDFKRFTNRDGEHLLDANLLAAMKQATAVDASKFGNNSKFLQ